MAHGQGGRGRTPGVHVHAWERGFCLRVCGRLGRPPVVYRACGVWAPRRGWHELWLACAAACGRERCVLCVVRWGLPSHRRVFLYSILSEQVSAVSRAADNCPRVSPHTQVLASCRRRRDVGTLAPSVVSWSPPALRHVVAMHTNRAACTLCDQDVRERCRARGHAKPG